MNSVAFSSQVRLAEGAYICVEFRNGEFHLYNSQDSLIGIVSKDDTYSTKGESVHKMSLCGQWGKWALAQRMRLQNKTAPYHSKKPIDKWKTWANSKVASLRLRLKSRLGIPKRLIRKQNKHQGYDWPYWKRVQWQLLNYQRSRGRRDQWTIWAETKASNWTKKSRMKLWNQRSVKSRQEKSTTS